MSIRQHARRSICAAIDTLEARRLMATFTVTNINDTGAGSLRAAIASANATTAADVINFNIGGVITDIKMITLGSTLTITQPVTIDATTQPGYASAPVVRLSGQAGNDILAIDAAGSVVRGLSLTGGFNGVFVSKPNVTIEKNYIGLAPDGTVAGNASDGILTTIPSNPANVANALSLKYNVISGNSGDGVELQADNAYIVGNIIGLDPTGQFARGNGGNGIRISGGDNLTIGDGGDVNRNIISANQVGIRYVTPSTGGIIINSYFGTDRAGNAFLPNLSGGISGVTVTNLTIGVPTLGNRFAGGAIDLNTNSSSNIIAENVVGVGIDPSIDLGGGNTTGIDLRGTLNQVTNNVIANTTMGIQIEGSNNTVSDNHVGVMPDGRAVGLTTGVYFPTGSSNYVTGNKIANCAVNGVQLVTGNNNYFDNATWANSRSYRFTNGSANDALPKPVISSIFENASGSYTINVAYVSVPAGTYQIKLYSSDQAGDSASGHTQRLLQTATFTSSGGNATRSYTITGTPLDSKFITATISEVISTNLFGSTAEPSIALKANGTPALAGSGFEFETKHTVRFDFTSVTNSSVNIGDLTIRNLATLQTFSAETMTVSGLSYRFNRTSPLPDGNYEAVIPVGAVSNANGTNKLSMSMNFHVLAGDANRDKKVDFDDLLILASNYNSTGKTFSQANFNYDAAGSVNFDDLLILASRYNQSLAAGPAGAPQFAGGDDDNGSVGDDVLL
jgi:hypothetical protein